MRELIDGIAGLITAVAVMVGALTTLLIAFRDRRTPPGDTPETRVRKRRRYLVLCSALLTIFGGAIFAARWTSPTLSITKPAAGLEVTAHEYSVWFPVSGESTHISSGSTLRIYVLVDSGTEWHVQSPTTVLPDGSWSLQQAWIGGPSAPIRVGSTLRIIAVASSQVRNKDETVQDYRELEPKAVSQMRTVLVQTIRPEARPLSAKEGP